MFSEELRKRTQGSFGTQFCLFGTLHLERRFSPLERFTWNALRFLTRIHPFWDPPHP